MPRNISSVVGDDVYEMLEKERMKRGVLKSKAVDMLLRETLSKEKDVSKIDGLIDDKNKNAELIKEMESIVLDNEKLLEKTQKIKEREKSNEHSELETRNDIIVVTNDKEAEEKKIEEKKELKDLSSLKNLKQDEQKPVDDVNRLDNLVINKISTSEPKEQNNDINKQRIVAETRPKAKFTIRKVKRVNDEENVGTVLTERDVEHKVNKLLDEKKFNESFKDMHGKVDKVCEDGKCLKDKVNSLELKLGKIDEVCENGKCIRTEIGELRKELNEFKDLKKSLDDLKGGVTDIKGGVTDIKGTFINLDKKIVKKELCPTCGSGVEEGSSYCPNCGLGIKEWNDDKGNKLDWKPYSQRKTDK